MESRNPSPIMPQRGEEPSASAGHPRRVSPTPNHPSYYDKNEERYAHQGSPSFHHRHYHSPPQYDSPNYHHRHYHHERSYAVPRGAPPPPHFYSRAHSSAAHHYSPHYGAPPPPRHHHHHYHALHQTRSPKNRVPASPPKMFDHGHYREPTSPLVPLYEELVRTSGLPKSLSFRKICSRCGKTRGEHGELGFGNKCVFQECGKCGAGVHVHKKANQPMGILCQLTVEEGATAGAASAYERKIKDLAARADLQKEMRRRHDDDSVIDDCGREAPAHAA